VDRVRHVTVQHHASAVKYAIEEDGLKAMAAGGGWRSLKDNRFHYVVAVFESGDMQTMLGQVEVGAYPRALAFHPVLNLGAVLRQGGEVSLKLFKASSLADRQTIALPNQHPAPQRAHRLMFAGRGTTLVHHYRETLNFVRLTLSEAEIRSVESK
jgi:hypothetical protein